MAEPVKLTPLMEQYINIKKQHPDEVVFFRLGDFYEMFFEDAVMVSRLLNLTLTHRADSPMCGVPYHASKVYIARLLRFGKKIAICEQVGEIAPAGGLTERKVIEIITPGTAVETEYLEQGVNNFLACLNVYHGKAGFAYIDVTTSEFKATSWNASLMQEYFAKELGRCNPKELLLPLSLKENSVIKNTLEQNPSISVSYYPDWHFNAESSFKKLTEQFKTANLNSFGLTDQSPEILPAGFLLEYLEKTTNTQVPHVKGISVYHDSEYVIIDESSRRNLEIIYNLRDGTTQFSLLDCMNYTLTAMGNRLIRSWLLSPLCDVKKIQKRQNHVQLLFKDNELLKELREYLAPVLDIERLAGRIAMEKAHAKDLQALRCSIDSWLKVRESLKDKDLVSLPLDDAKYISDLILQSIHEDPATSLTEGRIIKRGWSQELDHYYDIQSNFNQILDEYLEEEKVKTGIQNLKIKHNSASGYVLEVTKGKLGSVPEHFIMRRSLMNAERYTTQRLQELEQELNSASSKIIETEKALFLEVRNKLSEYVPYLMELSHEISYVDVICSFAHAAIINRWVKPEVNDSYKFKIEEGRHPVVEKHLPSGQFVPNSINISAEDDSVSFGLITGPNMAGKSTYLRQSALITLMAQTGSYIPAKSAVIGVVDKIFCRVGASDNLARGESTFLVEMTETALILKSSTRRSLVIMDEVGRGTSTEDGLSIAWAVSEYLLNSVQSRTLFATHYHELTRIEHKKLKLLCMDVKETGGDIIFLRKIKEGAAENSYGIHVAQLAGIPESVIDRANVILEQIQNKAKDNPIVIESKKTEKIIKVEEAPKFTAPGLFSDEEIILDEILSCDVDNITPMNAMNLISRWKKALSGR
ncbi:MAG: DNA mismatch repair protein MutS [Treponema sp.]|uniref:DNA mismatch repair protein MutS n=1 Tax=Treponema sp. TaxID=166 RepID=UPI001D21E547|nr:DNA mismatch repair protein MutS [Treponema sp.]MBS7310796.1 DNA mismatch repair protein MutS [Treponema sp.]